MKLGLLGDIHANHLALSAVLSAATRQGVECLLITGDIVGYYFFPREVLTFLEPWSKFMVRGNHEDMLHRSMTDVGELASITLRYGSGIQLALDQLSEKECEKLTELPHPLALTLGGRNILLCHGAPTDINKYIYPNSDLTAIKNHVTESTDLVVLGHTHYPMLRQLSDTTRLVNPGSVGQPRNGCTGACWASYDTENNKVTLHCEDYDHSQVQNEARIRHPELPYLAEVLSRK